MELSFNFIAVIFITIRALAKSKIITYVRGKLKNLHDEIKCFSHHVNVISYFLKSDKGYLFLEFFC